MSVKVEQSTEAPGQISLGFEKRPAIDVLGQLALSGHTLDLALRTRQIGGQLPDGFKFYRLAVWRPEARDFLAKEIAQSKRWAAQNTQKLAEGSVPEWRVSETTSYVQRTEALIAPEDIEEAPVEWANFMASLTLAERSVVGRLVGSVQPGSLSYRLRPDFFTVTMADVRAANPEVIDLGNGLLKETPSMEIFLRKHNSLASIFKAVAFGKDHPQS